MSYQIHQGDALAVLRTLEGGSVHCCVTSPPYWGLRDYGTASWSGGLHDCDHAYNHGTQGVTGQRADRTFTAQAVYRHECRRCGAVRVDQQLGLERTPEEFVGRLVAIMSEVRRVLRPDATLWMNLGDSYSGNRGNTLDKPGFDNKAANGGATLAIAHPKIVAGLKPKDLVGIPWRVAFALQADGWYLRSDIIWAKPAPMPESVTDRPTRSHEYIFLLAKSERYYYDQDAIMEPAVNGTLTGGAYAPPGQKAHSNARPSAPKGSFNGKTEAMADTGQNAFRAVTETRNKRDVWTVNTKPFLEAHFATFPEELILPCILAGCAEGGTVLDPFAGAFTTGLVAEKWGRNSVLIELNPEYCEMGRKRLDNFAPLFLRDTTELSA